MCPRYLDPAEFDELSVIRSCGEGQVAAHDERHLCCGQLPLISKIFDFTKTPVGFRRPRPGQSNRPGQSTGDLQQACICQEPNCRGPNGATSRSPSACGWPAACPTTWPPPPASARSACPTSRPCSAPTDWLTRPRDAPAGIEWLRQHSANGTPPAPPRGRSQASTRSGRGLLASPDGNVLDQMSWVPGSRLRSRPT